MQVSKDLIFMGADLLRPRMTVEQEKMKSRFPNFQFYAQNGRVNSVKGYLETSYNNSYYVKILISSNYPYDMPKIELPYTSIDSACPHIYTNDRLCVMKSDQWTTTYSIAFMVGKTAVWLNKYDSWKRKGKIRWPGNDQHR